MSGQSGGQRLHLSTLNEQLTCKLCGGYFVDATTIIECLHTFCKSCIVKHLEINKYCPACNAQVHKNKPLLNIRPDHMLQDIVYKLVPGFYQNEMRSRKEFYAKHPEEKNNITSPESRGEPVESYIYSPDESLSLSLEYYTPEVKDEKENEQEAELKHLPRRYLRCPAAVTIFHLQKLIRAKYGLSEAHRVDIMYKEEPLSGNYTLMDVMYIYHWKRKVPLHLSYRIFESASKRLRLSEDNNEFQQSLSNSNMEYESKDDEQSSKREWKEVQLKISETGVMSVTDISSLDSKKSTKDKETSEQSGSDQASLNTCSVNKSVVKEEKESTKSCTAKNRKSQDKSAKICEKAAEEKVNSATSNTTSGSQDNLKNEGMKVKTIDQRDLSNQLMKADNDYKHKRAGAGSIKLPNIEEKSQAHELSENIKTEPTSVPEKRTETKPNLTNNNSINNESKSETKQNAKSNDSKAALSAGSKINALSAKLQFQPKVGQVNNTYSRKSPVTDRKAPSPVKSTESKDQKNSIKSEPKSSSDTVANSATDTSESKAEVTSMPSPSKPSASKPSSLSKSNLTNNSSATYVTASSGSTNTSASTASSHQHNNILHSLGVPTTESLASIGLHVSTTIPSQMNLNSWMTDRTAAMNSSKNSAGKSLSAEQQLRSIPGMPHIGKDIVCSTTSGNTSSISRFNIQTPSMSIYSISATTKNNQAFASPAHNYSNSSKQATPKLSPDVTTMYPVPPCPDAIPISLMKSTNARKDAATKGTTLNEICAKITSNAGSKINDICAKIGESSKEKNKERKPEVPDLLKIPNKSPTVSEASSPVKHIPNIPNVPIYTPSNSQALSVNDSKDKRLAIATVAQAAMLSQMQKMTPQKKPSQAVGYKTLRDPPKSWNPTLSKNNYVAAKNQAKEMQNQTQAAYGLTDGNSASKQIASKPAKIFKIRNMPRYLGNPASGVKPMYGVSSEPSKEKEQSTSSKSSPTMMKIDPQTLSPIISSQNSPIVSPPPYSPTARSYQNSPFTRDICRNSNSPISPRNSPVNMLSTNPFIPSHTPNTNPRLIYSHFPPGFTDASRFSNPLIRTPIGIPPPSAFHSSLPPSINKLYQRSGYLAQPQTSVAGLSAIPQPPTIQRIPPSSHSTPSPTSPSSKSPKTSSKSPSASINLARSDLLAATSPSASVVDSVALQLAKGLAQRDLNIFDLTRAEALKSSGDNKSAPSPQKDMKSKSTASSEMQKQGTKSQTKQSESDSTSKSSEPENKSSNATTAEATKEADKKEKSLASKVNGGINTSTTSNEKPKGEAAEQRIKGEKVTDSQKAGDEASSKSSKSTTLKTAGAQDQADDKKSIDVQVKKEVVMADTGKMESAQGKKIMTEAQKSKIES